jgi:hypothetical protein
MPAVSRRAAAAGKIRRIIFAIDRILVCDCPIRSARRLPLQPTSYDGAVFFALEFACLSY